MARNPSRNSLKRFVDALPGVWSAALMEAILRDLRWHLGYVVLSAIADVRGKGVWGRTNREN
jgi:hypothetical protein